ncbi:MAG: cytochrome c [Proteobacteria bacterium]|nr:cytochrome c [Pseudomonadota bacterium]
MRRQLYQAGAVVVGVLAFSTVTFGLPWDIDMADSQAVKAYEREAAPLPEGVVSQEHVLTPRSWTPNYERTSPEGMALTAPFAADEAVLANGQRMYEVYCTPCHGADGINPGPVGQPGRFPGVLPLLGPNGQVAKRTDGFIYLTVRNGGAVMPYYGWAMTDDEMWSLVHYLRSQPDGKYTPPAPVEETE